MGQHGKKIAHHNIFPFLNSRDDAMFYAVVGFIGQQVNRVIFIHYSLTMALAFHIKDSEDIPMLFSAVSNQIICFFDGGIAIAIAHVNVIIIIVHCLVVRHTHEQFIVCLQTAVDILTYECILTSCFTLIRLILCTNHKSECCKKKIILK